MKTARRTNREDEERRLLNVWKNSNRGASGGGGSTSASRMAAGTGAGRQQTSFSSRQQAPAPERRPVFALPQAARGTSGTRSGGFGTRTTGGRTEFQPVRELVASLASGRRSGAQTARQAGWPQPGAEQRQTERPVWNGLFSRPESTQSRQAAAAARAQQNAQVAGRALSWLDDKMEQNGNGALAAWQAQNRAARDEQNEQKEARERQATQAFGRWMSNADARPEDGTAAPMFTAPSSYSPAMQLVQPVTQNTQQAWRTVRDAKNEQKAAREAEQATRLDDALARMPAEVRNAPDKTPLEATMSRTAAVADYRMSQYAEIITDEDVDTLAYLAENYGKETAQAYADRLKAGAGDRAMEHMAETIRDEDASALERGATRVLAGANSVTHNMAGSAAYTADMVAQTAKNVWYGEDRAVAADTRSSEIMQNAQELRELTSEGMGGVGKFLTNAALDVGNMALNWGLFGPTAGVAMGAQAGAQSAYDVGQRGGTLTQQWAKGIADGVAEGIGESISIGKLEKIVDNPVAKKTLRDFAKRTLAQMGIEATEEAATEAMNLGSDLLLMGDKAQTRQMIETYLDAHPGEQGAAVAFAAGEAAKQIFMAGLQGGFVGGVMGGGTYAFTPTRQTNASIDPRLMPGAPDTRGVARARTETAALPAGAAQGGTRADAGAMSTPELVERYQQRRALERELNQTVYKEGLSADEMQFANDMVAGRRDVERGIPAGYDMQGILRVYEAKKAYNDINGPIKQYRENVRQGFIDNAEPFLANSDTWKDKPAGLLYSMETMERNVRDVVKNAAEADALNAEYFTPVHASEAAKTRWLEGLRGQVRQLGLNRHESVMVQIEGELRGAAAAQEMGLFRPENELALLERAKTEYLDKFGSKIDGGKVDAGIELLRGIYDGVLQQMNETYVQNGYEPIAYRQGYFPHFTAEGEGILNKVAGAFGLETQGANLPTDIAGLTDIFTPGRRWNPNAKERQGFETAYDALAGLDRYLGVAGDVIYHTGDIQKLRGLEKAIRQRHADEATRQRMRDIENSDTLSEDEKLAAIANMEQKGQLSGFVQELHEYTNLLAGKKSVLDRGAEKMLGRWIYGVMKKLEGRVAANMVGGNIASAMTNFIPIQQAAAETSTASMLRAAKDTVKNYAHNDGFVQESDFLTNRAGSQALSRTGLEKAGDIAAKPMEFVDEFASNIVTRARFYENVKNGMDRQSAMHEADAWAAGLMADRSKGAMPTIFESRNPLIKMVSMFQLEVNNQLRHIAKDIPRDMKEKGLGQVVLLVMKYMIGAFLYNDIYEKLAGRRPALDPLGFINEAVGDFTGFELPNTVDAVGGLLQGEGPDFTTQKMSAGQAIADIGRQAAEELPFIGGLLGGGRIPISSALPNVADIVTAGTGWASGDVAPEKAKSTIGKELAKPLYYLLPPFGGGQLKKTVEGLQTVTGGGSYGMNSAGERQLQFPVENPNVIDYLQAALFGKYALPEAREYAESGYRSQSAARTANFESARQVGMDWNTFQDWQQEVGGIAADTGEDGEPVQGSKREKTIEAVLAHDNLTPEQRLELLYSSGGYNFREELAPILAAGIDADTALDWLATEGSVAPDLDEDGEPVDGSRKEKLLEAVRGYNNLSPEQQLELLYANGDYDFREELAPVLAAGIDAGTALNWWREKDSLTPDLNEDGEPVPGSKKSKAVGAAMAHSSLTPEQQVELLRAAGYDMDKEFAPGREAGIETGTLLDWWTERDNITADYDEEGKEIYGSKNANTLAAVLAHDDLTPEQQLELAFSAKNYLREDMAEGLTAGIDAGTMLDWWAYFLGEHGTGKKQRIIDTANSLPLDDEQKFILMKAAGVAKDGEEWRVGGGGGGGQRKSGGRRRSGGKAGGKKAKSEVKTQNLTLLDGIFPVPGGTQGGKKQGSGTQALFGAGPLATRTSAGRTVDIEQWQRELARVVEQARQNSGISTEAQKNAIAAIIAGRKPSGAGYL